MRLMAILMIAGTLGQMTGCPTDSSTTGVIETQISGPATANSGELVSLSAVLPSHPDPSKVTYQWAQLRGKTVTLDNSTGGGISFTAPALPREQTFRFQVQTSDPSGAIGSAAVDILIGADGLLASQYDANPNTPSDEDDGKDPDDDRPDTPGNGGNGGGDDGGDDGEVEDPKPRVRLNTTMGNIVLELDRVAAPITVENFLQYVDDDYYDGTIFHRVIPDFVIQGGGFLPGVVPKTGLLDPIENESDNGLLNVRASVAMARTNQLDSATSQFFINLKDNDSLDPTEDNNGYAVFGRVISGMGVVDAIANLSTTTVNGLQDVPVSDVVIIRADRLPQ